MGERHHWYVWYDGSSKQSGGGQASISQRHLGSDVLTRISLLSSIEVSLHKIEAALVKGSSWYMQACHVVNVCGPVVMLSRSSRGEVLKLQQFAFCWRKANSKHLWGQLPTTQTTIRSWPLPSRAIDQTMATTNWVDNMIRWCTKELFSQWYKICQWISKMSNLQWAPRPNNFKMRHVVSLSAA